MKRVEKQRKRRCKQWETRKKGVCTFFLVGAVGDETSALVGLGGDTGDGVDLVGTSILVGSLLPLLGQGNGLLAT